MGNTLEDQSLRDPLLLEDTEYHLLVMNGGGLLRTFVQHIRFSNFADLTTTFRLIHDTTGEALTADSDGILQQSDDECVLPFQISWNHKVLAGNTVIEPSGDDQIPMDGESTLWVRASIANTLTVTPFGFIVTNNRTIIQ